MKNQTKNENLLKNSNYISNTKIGFKTSLEQLAPKNETKKDFTIEKQQMCIPVNEEMICILNFVADYFIDKKQKVNPIYLEDNLIKNINKVFTKYHEDLY